MDYEVKLSKADYRLILNARVYGGIFWATMGLSVAWMLSWVVAPRFSDYPQLAMSIPPLAYFILYFVGILRRKPIAAARDPWSDTYIDPKFSVPEIAIATKIILSKSAVYEGAVDKHG